MVFNMLKISLLSLLLITVATEAYATALSGQLFCGINSFYSTLKIDWNLERLQIRIENPRGYEAMPQFEAPISPELFKSMEMQTRDLAGLGSVFIYEWPMSKCQFSNSDPYQLACRGRGTLIKGPEGVEALSLSTAALTESSLNGDSQVIRARLIFGVNNKMYFVAIPFPREKCRVPG